MSWEFKVGQKVVYIGDDAPAAPSAAHCLTWLEVSEVYTIRQITEAHFWCALGSMGILPGIRLVGIYRQYLEGHGYADTKDFPFAAYAFRPLVTDTQSWLKEILETPPPAKVRELVPSSPKGGSYTNSPLQQEGG